jgi:neurexin
MVAAISLYLPEFLSVQDTFYDPEDGSTRSLKLTLLTVDRSQVPVINWLQFDIKNQEFFGIPMKEDEGRKEYQLVSVLHADSVFHYFGMCLEHI